MRRDPRSSGLFTTLHSFSFSMRSLFQKLAIITLLIGFVCSPAQAVDDPDVKFTGGNRAFEDGRYDDAERVYRQLFEDGNISIELLVNLGNALYRLDRPGEAALWYRRALELDPRAAEARQNLRVVKLETGYREFDLSGLNAWLSRISPGELTAALSIGLWLVALSLAAAFTLPFLRDWRPLLFVTASLGLVFALASAWGLRRQQDQLDTEDLAIVTGNETAAVTQPLPEAEKVVDLPPGSEIQIIQQRGPWTYVGIPDELRGWVRTDAIGAVRWFGPNGLPPVAPGLAEKSE